MRHGRSNYTILGELPGLNEVIKEAKGHWSRYSKLKSQYTLLCSVSAKELPLLVGPIRIDIDWFCKDRRRDPDNICSAKKFILDGLVDAGALANDGWAQVTEFRDRFHVSKHDPRVEVHLQGVLDV